VLLWVHLSRDCHLNCAYTYASPQINRNGPPLTLFIPHKTTFSDLVVIHPQDFSKPTSEAIEDEINAKYANKVVYNIGLCICLYDVLKASEGLIGYGNGSANVHGRAPPP